jgi:homoaconitase/3-isopropylmalate dehydratase large subunit
MTMAEKVLARCSGRATVQAGEYLTAAVDLVMVHEAFTLCGIKLVGLGIEKLFDPDRVLVILDHYFPAPSEQMARGHAIARDLVRRFGIRHFLGHAGN